MQMNLRGTIDELDGLDKLDRRQGNKPSADSHSVCRSWRMTNASLLYIQTIILHQELTEANGQNTIFIATRKNVILDNNNLLERIAYRTQRTLLLLDLLLGWQGIRRLDIIALTTAINHKIHLYLLANRIASFVIFSYLYYKYFWRENNMLFNIFAYMGIFLKWCKGSIFFTYRQTILWKTHIFSKKNGKMCTMYLFELFSKSIRVILISLRSNDYFLSRRWKENNFW